MSEAFETLEDHDEEDDDDEDDDNADSDEGNENRSVPPDVLAALGGCAEPQGQFEKISCLGEGAFGAVWLARRRSDDVYVALKEVPRCKLFNDEHFRNLWAERDCLLTITQARQAEHAAVSCVFVGAITTYATTQAACLAMDLVEGAPLHVHVRSAGKLEVPAARWYTAELADALAWLHGAGWIYRDLKMANVMVDARSGRTRLIDFGFAKKCTSARSVVGTLHVMAPEVIGCAFDDLNQFSEANFSAGYDRKVDWWALGVVLFEMLTGEAPFGYCDDISLEGRQLFERQAAAAQQGLSWPDELQPSLCKTAIKLVNELLEFDATSRLGFTALDDLCRQDFFKELDWASITSPSSPGPAFDRSLGHTLESALANPQRPRRQGLNVGGPAPGDTDPLENF